MTFNQLKTIIFACRKCDNGEGGILLKSCNNHNIYKLLPDMDGATLGGGETPCLDDREASPWRLSTTCRSIPSHCSLDCRSKSPADRNSVSSGVQGYGAYNSVNLGDKTVNFSCSQN